MKSFFWLIDTVLSLYMWAIIIQVITSWLIVFNVVNSYNRFVASLLDILGRVTEPAYAQIRRVIPTINGIDFAPLVLILLIAFLRSLIREYVF